MAKIGRNIKTLNIVNMFKIKYKVYLNIGIPNVLEATSTTSGNWQENYKTLQFK
jgi:hypothetical protein